MFAGGRAGRAIPDVHHGRTLAVEYFTVGGVLASRKRKAMAPDPARLIARPEQVFVERIL